MKYSVRKAHMILKYVTCITTVAMCLGLVVPAFAVSFTELKDSPHTYSNISGSTVKITSEQMTMSDQSYDNIRGLTYQTGNNSLLSLAPVDICNMDNHLNCTIQLKSMDSDYSSSTATGTIRLADTTYSFDVNGTLKRVYAQNGDTVYLGALSGYVDEKHTSESMITLSINYNATTGDVYLPICLGSFGNDEVPPVQVEFGAVFSELTSAVQSLTDNLSVAQESENTSDSAKDPMYSSPNTKLVCHSTNLGSYQGKKVIFGSFYGAKEALPSGSWDGRVKAQVNLDNFITAYEDSLPPHTPDYTGIIRGENYYVSSIWLNAKTSVDRCRIVDPTPDAFSKTLPISIPLDTPYGLLNYVASLVSIEIPLTGVSHTRNAAGNQLETKLWNDRSGISDVCVTGTNPYNQKNGIANYFMIHNTLDAGKPLKVTTNVSAEISFIAVQADGLSYLKAITVSSDNDTFTLDSV